MDDDQQALNQTGGEEAIEPTTPVDEPKATEDVETPVPESTDEATEETQTETEDIPKKGAQSRIRELNAKAKSAEDRAKSLEQQLAELTGSVEPQVPRAPYTPQVQPGAELTPEQYHQDVLRTAGTLVDLEIKKNNAINRIQTEATQVIKDYPQLDPDSEQFDRELSESITEATTAFVKANPYTASPKKFVDKLMKPYTRAVTKEVGKATENIAKQVSEAATRPTSVSTKGGKSEKDKSIKELESELGFYN